MNQIIFRYLLVSLAAAACMGCAAPQQSIAGKGYIHHVVVAWLKQPGDAAAQQQLIEGSKSFADIPGVIAVTAGPTFSSNRAVVDDSFDVALTVILKDQAALQNYQNHPLHVRVKQELLKPLVTRYLVYNYID